MNISTLRQSLGRLANTRHDGRHRPGPLKPVRCKGVCSAEADCVNAGSVALR